MTRTSHGTLSKMLSHLSAPRCVRANQMVKGHLPASQVYIKIGVSGECLLGSENVAYGACGNLGDGVRRLCPSRLAYAPWLRVSDVRADSALRHAIAPFIVSLADKSYIDMLVLQSCGTKTMADYIKSATPMQISMMMCRCGDQIRRMNVLGVYHQDMHTRNVVIGGEVPHVIDFEFALTGATPNPCLGAYDKEHVADNIRTRPHPGCDLHKFACDVWTRSGSPTDGIIFATVHAMMGYTPIGTPNSLKTIPVQTSTWSSADGYTCTL